jgi:C4-dicarboxylate-specific signal transduction histidine kinase
VLAGHVALAIENGRLQAETREHADRLAHAYDRLVVAERIATVSRLAAGLGHEIGNACAAAMAHLEIAHDLVRAGKLGELPDALDRVALGANGIHDICQALRPLGVAGDRVQSIVLSRVLEGTALLLSHELRGRARLVIEDAAREALVLAQPARLGQVFLNLLLNAVNAISPGAPDEHEIRIGAVRNGERVVVTVTDTGRGLPADMVERLFDPGVTTRERGLGMGLPICRWMLEEMGGSITAVPLAKGARFDITLRSAPPA